MIKDLNLFTKKEIEYIHNASSIDFVFFDQMDKHPILFIEVDGFQFHENNPAQLNRDILKNNIANKLQIPLIRFKTYKTYSEEDIIKQVRDVLFCSKT